MGYDSYRSVIAWHVDTVTDAYGNQMQYSYNQKTISEDLGNVSVSTRETRIVRIEYDYPDQTTTSAGLFPVDDTHDGALRCWLESANDPASDFPIQNLPLGRFRMAGDASGPWRLGVAIGDCIVDLQRAARWWHRRT